MGSQIKKKGNFLRMDDFGVKYFSKYYADHLIELPKNHYEISTDGEGRNYLSLKIDWNYK